jgi:hypothetical protein
MQTNIDTNGRILRLIGASFLFLYAWWAYSLFAALLGLFCLYEAIAGWCAVYDYLGKSTCDLPKPLPYRQIVFVAIAIGFLLDAGLNIANNQFLFIAVDLALSAYLFYLAFKN